MQHRKKVVMVINSMEGGGAERVLSNLVHRMVWDFNVTVITLDNRQMFHPMPEPAEVVCVDAGNLVSTFFAFILCLKKIRPDTVVGFLTRANQFCVASRLFFKHKVVISERSTASLRFGSASIYHRLNRIMIRIGYRFAHTVIANSNGGRKDLIDNFSIPGKKVVTIYNPFPIEEIQKQGNALFHPCKPYICTIGRLCEAKRFDLLIRAYAAANLKFRLIILGEGPLRSDLESLIKRLGVADKVFLPGYFKNPYPVLKQCRFFVLSSQREGFPNGLTEALILGKAVIATDCRSGPREILDPKGLTPVKDLHCGEFGLLVPCNKEKILARALILMDKEGALRKQYENNALKHTDSFHINRIYMAYKQILINETTS